MKRTRKLTTAALLTALAVGLICTAAWLPRGGLALVALAAMVTAVVLIECGSTWALGQYLATTLLTFLLAADKTLPLWYALVFGHYPILKHYIERLSPALLRWCFKLALALGTMALIYALFASAFVRVLPPLPVWVLLPALGVVFALYDIAFSRLIQLYLRRIHRAT